MFVLILCRPLSWVLWKLQNTNSTLQQCQTLAVNWPINTIRALCVDIKFHPEYLVLLSIYTHLTYRWVECKTLGWSMSLNISHLRVTFALEKKCHLLAWVLASPIFCTAHFFVGGNQHQNWNTHAQHTNTCIQIRIQIIAGDHKMGLVVDSLYMWSRIDIGKWDTNNATQILLCACPPLLFDENKSILLNPIILNNHHMDPTHKN